MNEKLLTNYEFALFIYEDVYMLPYQHSVYLTVAEWFRKKISMKRNKKKIMEKINNDMVCMRNSVNVRWFQLLFLSRVKKQQNKLQEKPIKKKQ